MESAMFSSHDRLPPGECTEVLRILDANANRACEGLRVMEEYLRFVLQDRHLTSVCKQLRHDLAAVLGELPPGATAAARNTQGDVGTAVVAEQEYRRSRPGDVWQASNKRLQQALRCLEEYGKIWTSFPAGEIESLRYRAYTLEKAVTQTSSARARLAASRLYVLLDAGDSPQRLAQLAEALMAAGVDVLQLRDKRIDDRTLAARARLLRQVTRGTSTLLVINDRPDIACLADADGVHVGQEELTVQDVRTVAGPELLVGVSTHSLAQAREAVCDGADYLGCGPTFPSSTKTFAQFPGLEFLRQVAGEISLPAFAIGGIDRANVEQVLATGCRRIAVSGDVLNAADPATAASQLKQRLLASEPASPQQS